MHFLEQTITDDEFSLLKEFLGEEFGLSFATYAKEDLAKKLSTRLKSKN